MNFLQSLFDINAIFFQIFDYQMSYLEFFGTVFSILCVWFSAKAKILAWPLGLIGSILYISLFYQIQLYSDMLEQFFFALTGIAGWYLWTAHKKEINKQDHTVKISLNTTRQNLIYLAIIILGTVLLTYITVNLNIWLPTYFPEPVSLPELDSFTTVVSFVAQWLLMRKKLESWILWIIIDAIGIGLYWYKGVKFISAEYVLFLVIAIFGLISWYKNYQKNHLIENA